MSTVNVGSQVTCQYGNRSDSSGFRQSVQVTVLAVNENKFCTTYLVKEEGSDLYACATLPIPENHPEVKDVLYSTQAMRVGFRNHWTPQWIANYMGFKDFIA